MLWRRQSKTSRHVLPTHILPRAKGRRCRREAKALGASVPRPLLEREPEELAPSFILGQFFPSCQQLFRATRTGQHVPSGHSPGDPNIQRKVGGSREAAGAMVGRLSSVRHPLFPLWFSFLLLCRLQSLQVPWSVYPLENIYNLLTSWGLFVLFRYFFFFFL